MGRMQSESWIRAAVARLWSPARPPTVVPIRGDASARRFWRVSLDARRDRPCSAIAVDLGPDDLPVYARALGLVPEPLTEPPWLNVHRFLVRIGAGVPEIYAADIAARMLLVEDVGSMPLFDAAGRAHAGDLYRLAVDELLILDISGTEQ